MIIKFELRNEIGLHCRFCNNQHRDNNRFPVFMNLFETTPIKGIVCSNCKKHLQSYVSELK